jgi:hypothetical protein
MDRLRFFQGFAIALILIFLSVGGMFLRDSILHPEQAWELLGGALLCSLALMFGFILWKQTVGGKYL